MSNDCPIHFGFPHVQKSRQYIWRRQSSKQCDENKHIVPMSIRHISNRCMPGKTPYLRQWIHLLCLDHSCPKPNASGEISHLSKRSLPCGMSEDHQQFDMMSVIMIPSISR